MARTVIPPQAAESRSDRSADATSSDTGQSRAADKFPDKLVKYVPAEALAFFTPASAMGSGRRGLLIAAIIAGVIGTPGYLWLTARKLPKPQQPMVHFYILSIVAFICWALGTSSNADELVGLDTVAAGFTLMAAVFLIPLIDEGLTALLSKDKIKA